ncbi:MAG: cytidylate kinase family protein [Pygmaiobacter sp.]|nr:cytidylate kinase family protein [Pygmaiobacter sp.]
MNKIVLIEAKYSVGAEEIGNALAQNWNIPFIEGAANLTSPCVALNVGDSSKVSDDLSTVKIYLYADPLFRAALYASKSKADKKQADKIIVETDAAHREVFLSQNHREIGLTEDYDLCINTAFCNVTKSTKVAQNYVMSRILQECLSEIKD